MADPTLATLFNSSAVDLSWQRAFYEDLHAHPELSHEEERTAGRILEKLDDCDCEVVTGIGGHGIVAIFRLKGHFVWINRCGFPGQPGIMRRSCFVIGSNSPIGGINTG